MKRDWIAEIKKEYREGSRDKRQMMIFAGGMIIVSLIYGLCKVIYFMATVNLLALVLGVL